jgi:hypothetical protein
MTDQQKALEKAATALLHQAGCSWSGRDAKEAKRLAQGDVMKVAIRCPFSGKSRSKK